MEGWLSTPSSSLTGAATQSRQLRSHQLRGLPAGFLASQGSCKFSTLLICWDFVLGRAVCKRQGTLVSLCGGRFA